MILINGRWNKRGQYYRRRKYYSSDFICSYSLKPASVRQSLMNCCLVNAHSLSIRFKWLEYKVFYMRTCSSQAILQNERVMYLQDTEQDVGLMSLHIAVSYIVPQNKRSNSGWCSDISFPVHEVCFLWLSTSDVHATDTTSNHAQQVKLIKFIKLFNTYESSD